MKDLEEELGTVLLERRSGKMTLTEDDLLLEKDQKTLFLKKLLSIEISIWVVG